MKNIGKKDAELYHLSLKNAENRVPFHVGLMITSQSVTANRSDCKNYRASAYLAMQSPGRDVRVSLCLSVRPSVRLSVCHTLALSQNDAS